MFYTFFFFDCAILLEKMFVIDDEMGEKMMVFKKRPALSEINLNMVENAIVVVGFEKCGWSVLGFY